MFGDPGSGGVATGVPAWLLGTLLYSVRDSRTLRGSGSSGGGLSDGLLSGIEGDEGLLWYSDHSGVIGAPA